MLIQPRTAEMTHWAEAAYSGAVLDQWPGRVISCFQEDATSTLAVFSWHSEFKELAIAFEGSQDKRDWLRSNLQFRPVRVYEGGLLNGLNGRLPGYWHQGFYRAASRVLRAPLVPNQLEQASRIFLTGHSLGGADATVLAAILAAQGYGHKVVLITFGAPRVCTRAGARWLTAELGDEWQRWVHAFDGVPQVGWSMYRHGGRLLYIDSEHQLHFERGYRLWVKEAAKALIRPGLQLAFLAATAFAQDGVYIRVVDAGAGL